MLAAAPAWFADNLALIAVSTLAVLTILVVRLIQKTMTRVVLLGLITAAAVFVYVNRDALESCARTCECRLVEQDVTIPACDPDIL